MTVIIYPSSFGNNKVHVFIQAVQFTVLLTVICRVVKEFQKLIYREQNSKYIISSFVPFTYRADPAGL